MSFIIKKKNKDNYASPIELINDLSGRKVSGPWHIQGQVLTQYTDSHTGSKNLSIEMPTGTGKTLVAMLIAEWRRVSYKEKILYLCPTRQLANQTYNESIDKYGIKPVLFTGKKKNYDAKDVFGYTSNQNIAISTYNSLFNVKPFFEEPDIIIIDDAHSAESYLSSLYSLELNNWEQEDLFKEFLELFNPILERHEYHYFNGDVESNKNDSYLMPLPRYYDIIPDIISFFDASLTPYTNLWYTWSVIRDNLLTCNLYLSQNQISIRPYLFPVNTCKPFTKAKQRILFSANIGDDGSVEKLFSIKKLEKIRAVVGSEKQGVGRRFFYFPQIALENDQVESMLQSALDKFNRGLVLVASASMVEKYEEIFSATPNISIFKAKDIELSKQKFIDANPGVAIMANRYDGIDFPGDECRLLIIDDFPSAANLQEYFFVNQLGASFLLRAKTLTRINQAIGRCNRSTLDRSMVLILGEKLPQYLLSISNSKYFHPELQSEVMFAFEQSQHGDLSKFLLNMEDFLANNSSWGEAEASIISNRDDFSQAIPSYYTSLAESSVHEIDFSENMWSRNYIGALEDVKNIIAHTVTPDLQPFNVFWNYMAGNIYYILYKLSETDEYLANAKLHYSEAMKSPLGKSWLGSLITILNLTRETKKDTHDIISFLRARNLELTLMEVGIIHNRVYNKRKINILAGLESDNFSKFEQSHLDIGRFLGYEVKKLKGSGSSDCIWYLPGKICFVFEDNNETTSASTLITKKIDQANRHINRARSELSLKQDVQLYSIIITNAKKMDAKDLPNTNDILLCFQDDFVKWAKKMLEKFEEIKNTFRDEGNMYWYQSTADKIMDSDFHHDKFLEMLNKSKFNELEQK
ncbi:MAG: DEAD/DEAH box helicase family protein [Leptospirales bacterium]